MKRRATDQLLQIGALVVIATTWLLVFPYSQSLNNPNERTRVLQARSIVAKQELAIGSVAKSRRGFTYTDPYGVEHSHPFVNDVAMPCTDPRQKPPCAGPMFPAKAPGTALLGVPALAVARGLGAIPEGAAGEVRATWVLRLSVMALVLGGLAVLGALLRRAGVRPGIAAATVIAAGLGSSLFPYGVTFVGHAAASAALMIGVYLLVRAAEVKRGGHGLALLGGLATSSAVLFEYHAVPAVLAVAVWVALSSERNRLIWGFGAGAIAMLVLFANLHRLMYGDPFETGHHHLLSAHNRESQAKGFLGLDGLHPGSLAAHLFDGYLGLGPTMPWLLVGLAGIAILLRGRTGALPAGAARAVGAAVLTYLVFVTCLGNYRVMNGWSFGPRYLVPALLPLALAAGLAWEWAATKSAWLATAFAALVIHALIVMVALTLSYPSPPNDIRNPFAELALPLLWDGWGIRTFTSGLGRGWWAPFAVIVSGLAVAVGAVVAPNRGRWLHATVAVLGGLVLALTLALWRPTPKPQVDAARAFMQRTVEGASSTGNRRPLEAPRAP